MRKRNQRKQNTRISRPRFVLASEGAVTEREYFEAIKSLLGKDANITLEYAKRGAGQKHSSAPGQVVDCICKHLKKHILENRDFAWIIVDYDERSADELACLFQWQEKDKRYFLAISNPRFELWKMLHYMDKPRNKDLGTKLKEFDRDKHINPSDITKDSIHKAIMRAEKIDRPPCPQNKCPEYGVTIVYRLLRQILEAVSSGR